MGGSCSVRKRCSLTVEEVAYKCMEVVVVVGNYSFRYRQCHDEIHIIAYFSVTIVVVSDCGDMFYG
jgi:hypothetical protein